MKWVRENRKNQEEIGQKRAVYMTAKMPDCICAGISSVSVSFLVYLRLDVLTAFPSPETFSKDSSWMLRAAAGPIPALCWHIAGPLEMLPSAAFEELENKRCPFTTVNTVVLVPTSDVTAHSCLQICQSCAPALIPCESQFTLN